MISIGRCPVEREIASLTVDASSPLSSAVPITFKPVGDSSLEKVLAISVSV